MEQALIALDAAVPSTTRTKDQVIFDLGVAYGQFSKGIKESPAFVGTPLLIKVLRLQTELVRLQAFDWNTVITNPSFLQASALEDYYPLSLIADLGSYISDYMTTESLDSVASSLGRVMGYFVHLASDEAAALITAYVE